MTASPTFGPLLRQLRKRAGMTQGDLAAAVGYSVSFVSDLEQNRRLPAVMVVLQQFIPALGLQEETAFAAQLVELAARARGERPPTTVTIQRTTQLTVTDTFAFRASRLPAPPTPLIGREQTIKMLCNRLQGHHGRLLTLVGTAGVGKTRLGLAVASQAERLFKDGAYFVPLAAVTDPDLVAVTIANELELADTGQPSPQTRLVQGLRRKEMLLVLDNFEQILAAAPLLTTLLAECPGLYLLVTSRERLHLRAEQRFPVLPLDLDFACALFVQQAQAVDPAFEVTATTTPIIQAICRRLDCLPLAIELIAARIDLFSPQAMLTRLQTHGLDLLSDGAQDAPERHRTLRKAIHYSYNLLAEAERALFRAVGVFVDGFDAAAVAHVGFAAELLQALVNKSLVHLTTHPASVPTGALEQRFLLLETVRDYARELLRADEEETARAQQHMAYYLQWLETIEPKLRGPEVGLWLAHLEVEHNNLRAALTWAIAQGDGTTALRFCGAMRTLWDRHGHVHEAKGWLEKALAIGTTAPPAVQGKALSVAGQMELMTGNYSRAQTLLEEGLVLYQATPEQRGVAIILLQLGGVLRAQKQYTQARHFYEQSLERFHALADHWGIAATHIVLGHLAMNHSDYTQARLYYEQGLALQREVGDRLWIASALPGLAWLVFQQGEYQQAILYCEELLALARELGDHVDIVNALNELGRIALHQGDLAAATRYLCESLPLAYALNHPPLTAVALTYHGNLALAQGELTPARHYYGQSLQIAHQLADKVDIASGLESLAVVANAQQQGESAATLIGAAASLRQVIDLPLPTTIEQLLATIRTQLDDTTFRHAHTVGSAMTIAQAVAFAVAP